MVAEHQAARTYQHAKDFLNEMRVTEGVRMREKGEKKTKTKQKGATNAKSLP